ncbi:MAG: hypothetical protein F3739_01565 [Nitrospinae bacterium]|nr:hypothetical protein [Nitrospinota bacterium]
MIEQFLQTALEFLKEIWFQLNSRFDLENTEAFKFLKPYLLQLQENPLYLGVSLAALVLIPYGLIKVRSISRERERKLDELMEEMEEEEYDEDDPRRLRRPEPEDDGDKPLFVNEESEPSSYSKVVDTENDEDSEEEITEFELDALSSEDAENIAPVSSELADSDFEKDLNEFMAMEDNIELPADDSTHDQAIKELQEDGELMELDEPSSETDISESVSDLDEDEQDKAIKDLQEEMERTINQLTEQIEEPTEAPSSIKDLSQIHVSGDATIEEDYTEENDPVLEEEPSPETEPAHSLNEEPSLEQPHELSDNEILASLEPEIEETSSIESEPEYTIEEISDLESEPELKADSIPDTRDYEPEISGFTFEADILDEENEDSKGFTFEEQPIEIEESPEPEVTIEQSTLDHDYVPSGDADSLIDRLKFLQTRFENRYQSTEKPVTESAPAPVGKRIPEKDYASFTEARRQSSMALSPDSKKYMDLLESFVFMKDQRKHK